MTEVTAATPLFQVGDVGMRISISPQRRGVAHIISRFLSSTQVEVQTYYRPSKGFRRHIRREKAARRKTR